MSAMQLPAVVLSYDRYRAVAENMIACYEDLWPTHPFVFHIPYQDVPSAIIEKYGGRIKAIKSPKSIIETVETLLAGFGDEEWIYWCMDDRYPLNLDSSAISELVTWIRSEDPPVDGLIFTRSPRDRSIRNSYLWRHRIKTPDSRTYLRKKHYGSIWSHQFLRVKVIRALFANFPRELVQAKDMDAYLFRSRLPAEFRLYVARESAALFAESASRGALTENCVESMRRHRIAVPNDFPLTAPRIIQVSDTSLLKSVLWRLRDIGRYLVTR